MVNGWLEARGRQVVLTREPGGTAAAEKDPHCPA
jgi:thymidylate kinase